MRTIKVTTICTADVTEEWVLRVTERQAKRISSGALHPLDVIANEYDRVVSVENTSVENEVDRDVISIEEVLA
jgi:hypothetical protein